MQQGYLILETWQAGPLDFVLLALVLIILALYLKDRFSKKSRPSRRQEAILAAVDQKHTITTSEAATLLSVSQDTALRELTVLAESGILKRVGAGRGARYER